MRFFFLVWIILGTTLPFGCKSSDGNTRVVKPKTYKRFYDRKKDKRKKRTQVIKMKS
jgi:hypothetical protein